MRKASEDMVHGTLVRGAAERLVSLHCLELRQTSTCVRAQRNWYMGYLAETDWYES